MVRQFGVHILHIASLLTIQQRVIFDPFGNALVRRVSRRECILTFRLFRSAWDVLRSEKPGIHFPQRALAALRANSARRSGVILLTGSGLPCRANQGRRDSSGA